MKYPNRRNILALGSCILIAALTGCSNGAATNQNKATSQNKPSKNIKIVPSNSPYQGNVHLHNLVALANDKPKDEQAQLNAAISAFVNGQYQQSALYYQRVISIDSSNVNACNTLGNIYMRFLNQPKQALPYFRTVTQEQPTNSLGWVNLALCEKELGQSAEVKSTVTAALKVIPKTDSNYSTLKRLS